MVFNIPQWKSFLQGFDGIFELHFVVFATDYYFVLDIGAELET